jgi:hypothetical protein
MSKKMKIQTTETYTVFLKDTKETLVFRSREAALEALDSLGLYPDHLEGSAWIWSLSDEDLDYKGSMKRKVKILNEDGIEEDPPDDMHGKIYIKAGDNLYEEEDEDLYEKSGKEDAYEKIGDVHKETNDRAVFLIAIIGVIIAAAAFISLVSFAAALLTYLLG